MIDDTVFNRLAADLGVEHIGRVCRTFLATTAAGIDGVVSAIAAGDAAEVAAVTHRLKSSSGFLGARRLVSLCADIEGRAESAGVEGTRGVPELLAEELELASVELLRRVPGG